MNIRPEPVQSVVESLAGWAKATPDALAVLSPGRKPTTYWDLYQPETATSPRELRAWMLDRLSSYKVPRRIWVVDDFPRTRTGKVQRGELARRWSEDRK
jgi:acyl-coenzyme A synthetase/AMP-(fatty) acid ligase